MMITGRDIKNDFNDFDVETDPEIARLALDIARATLASQGIVLR